MKKILLVLLTLLTLAAAAIAGLRAFLHRFLPQTEGNARLPGLHGPVELMRDRWGTPHIYTEDEDDLFFAQGYVHAQDRLWQMELQRRMGAGRLSEVLGEATLPVDRFTRTLGLNRAPRPSWPACQPRPAAPWTPTPPASMPTSASAPAGGRWSSPCCASSRSPGDRWTAFTGPSS